MNKLFKSNRDRYASGQLYCIRDVTSIMDYCNVLAYRDRAKSP